MGKKRKKEEEGSRGDELLYAAGRGSVGGWVCVYSNRAGVAKRI